MAKMLTQVWKTVMGTFYETEEEAVRFEQKHILKQCIIAARNKALEPIVEKFEKELAEWERNGKYMQNRNRPKDPRWEEYKSPEGFFDNLVEEIFDKRGLTFPTQENSGD